MEIRGFPFLPRDLIASMTAAKWSQSVRTGLLTCGSSYRPRLPVCTKAISGNHAVFVPAHSDGLAPDLHGIPY